MRFLRTSTFPFRVFFDKIKALSMVRVRLSRCRCGNVAKIAWVAHQIDTQQDSGKLTSFSTLSRPVQSNFSKVSFVSYLVRHLAFSRIFNILIDLCANEEKLLTSWSNPLCKFRVVSGQSIFGEDQVRTVKICHWISTLGLIQKVIHYGQ